MLQAITRLAIAAPRRIIAIPVLVLVGAAVFGLPVINSLSAGGLQDPTSESSRATELPAHVSFMRMLGLGLTLAVLADATLVRMVLIPASIHLLGRWTWWAPGPLAWLRDRAATGEAAAIAVGRRRWAADSSEPTTSRPASDQELATTPADGS
jgi:hypothetical protein